MEKLKGKVALVTGGAQGLGKAIADVLIENNVQVVIGDIRIDEAKKIKNSKIFFLDVSNEKNVEEVVGEIVKSFGKIDILINNAAIDVTKPFVDFTPKEWRREIDVNLNGPFLLSKYVMPIMMGQKKGHIVNIVSTAAKRAWAQASAYHASKWGLLGLSHAMYVEARDFNIKVTAVVAGGMKTPFLLERFPGIDTGKLQDPLNVAKTIEFILKQPAETIITEVMVLPLYESSWP